MFTPKMPQSRIIQEYKEKIEEVKKQLHDGSNDDKITEVHTDDHTSSSLFGSLSNSAGSDVVVERDQEETIEPIRRTNNKEIITATKVLNTTNSNIEPIKEEKHLLNEEVKDNDTLYTINTKKQTKPKLVVVSSDINYEKNKGGNHYMILMYLSNNTIKFSKDDDDIVVIKNDDVKNIGGFHKFCSEIEKECKQKIAEGKEYYYEDYLTDNGFLQKEEEIDTIKKLKEILSIIMDDSDLQK